MTETRVIATAVAWAHARANYLAAVARWLDDSSLDNEAAKDLAHAELERATRHHFEATLAYDHRRAA